MEPNFNPLRCNIVLSKRYAQRHQSVDKYFCHIPRRHSQESLDVHPHEIAALTHQEVPNDFFLHKALVFYERALVVSGHKISLLRLCDVLLEAFAQLLDECAVRPGCVQIFNACTSKQKREKRLKLSALIKQLGCLADVAKA